MSSSFPSLTVTGGGLNVAADVSELTMSLRELVFGQGLAEFTLNNVGGKYVAAQWPPFTATSLLESGLYKVWSWTINGIGPWYGRVVGLDVDASIKAELIKVSVAMMDEPLHNFYLRRLIGQDSIGNMVLKGCQEWGGSGSNFTMGGITYTVDTSTNGKGPTYPAPAGYDCSRTRIYAADFIKDLLVAAFDVNNSFYGWQGYVDSLQGPSATTLYLFQQGAKTYGSSLTWGTNVSSFKNRRNILRSKNFIEYVAALSSSEPPLPYDTWTESDTSMWKAINGNVTSTKTHWCPYNGIEVNIPCYDTTIPGVYPGTFQSIPIDSAAIIGTGNPLTLDLSLQSALGENFNAILRNATTLNFTYKSDGYALSEGTVRLKDSHGMVIMSTYAGLPATGVTIRNAQNRNWVGWTYPIAMASQTFTTINGNTGWGFVSSPFWTILTQGDGSNGGNFDWGNMTDIIFNIQSLVEQGTFHLSIDHLYFGESYQPQAYGLDQDAITQYGQRMQYYDASMYVTDKTLQAFANARTTTLSPGLIDLDIITSLGPEAEVSGKGFQPGFCFAAGNVNIPNYNFDKVAWRAVEVKTHIVVPQALGGAEEAGLTTRFHLTPASGPLIGPNAAKFDSRRFW